MTDQTVTVTLPLDTARRLAAVNHDYADEAVLRDAIKDALPPEWEEGTVAWVHLDLGGARYLCERVDGEWRHGMRRVTEASVTKVEPLRVLCADEVAVKRVTDDLDLDCVRGWAQELRDDFRGGMAEVLEAYIAGHPAEERAR